MVHVVHETEVTERLIGNSDKNSFIELMQPRIIRTIQEKISTFSKQATSNDWENNFQDRAIIILFNGCISTSYVSSKFLIQFNSN